MTTNGDSDFHHGGGEDTEGAPLLHRRATGVVIAAAIDVHRALGPGLLESAYASCLAYELRCRGIPFREQVPLPVTYRGVSIDCAYRMDLVVDDSIVVEIKSVESIERIHHAQLITYMRLSGMRVGLLVNFNVDVLRRGIVRRVL